MATMLFYEKIVPLNRDRHRGLRLRTGQGRADFSAGTHYVPLAGTEFYQASRHYPVIFAGGEDGGPSPCWGCARGRTSSSKTDAGPPAPTFRPSSAAIPSSSPRAIGAMISPSASTKAMKASRKRRARRFSTRRARTATTSPA